MKNLKNKFILASAILALASCADNSYLGEQEEKTGAGGAISFGFDVPTPTRAGDASDAGKLGNYFIVYGEKGENGANKYNDGKLVFPNYTVKYTASTANTTTSNTMNWEYVGITPLSTTNVTYSDGTNSETAPATQTIKYWDEKENDYTFTAVSADKDDITNGRVKIKKNTVGTNNQYEKGYTIELAKTSGTSPEPDVYPKMDKLYFSDREVVAKTDYGKTVELTFRNSLSQVRAGIYETIPGYDIVGIKFHTATANTYTDNHAFGAVCKNTSATNFEGTINVVYYGDSDGDLKNKPKVTVTPGTGIQKDYLTLGDNFKNLTKTGTSVVLGTTASAPTWDQSEANKYTAVLPQPTNNENLTLTVDYTLWNSVTKETIEVTGKTAVVPAQYLQWKANYKYTYLFKITDDGLNPITFDAVVVNDGEGNQETITTVTEPSITTYQNGSNIATEGFEYAEGATIYVAVQDGAANPALIVSGADINAKLYTVTITGAYAGGITEASVAKTLTGTGTSGTWTATDANNNTMTVTAVTTGFDKATTIPAANSPTKSDLTINVATFTPDNLTADTYYVFEYATVYTPIVGAIAENTGYYTLSNGAYTGPTNTAVTEANNDGKTYYQKNTGAAVKKYYKVIKVKNSN